MLMPKKNRVAIYEHLFKEGVMVAEKNFNAPKHPELEAVPNLQVIRNNNYILFYMMKYFLTFVVSTDGDTSSMKP